LQKGANTSEKEHKGVKRSKRKRVAEWFTVQKLKVDMHHRQFEAISLLTENYYIVAIEISNGQIIINSI